MASQFSPTSALGNAVNVPDDFVVEDVAPLLLAFPGGGQSFDGAAGILEGTYSA